MEDRRFKVDMNLMGTSIWPKLFPARLWSRLYDSPKCTSILKCELIKCACFWLLIGIVCVYVGGHKDYTVDSMSMFGFHGFTKVLQLEICFWWCLSLSYIPSGPRHSQLKGMETELLASLIMLHLFWS